MKSGRHALLRKMGWESEIDGGEGGCEGGERREGEWVQMIVMERVSGNEGTRWHARLRGGGGPHRRGGNSIGVRDHVSTSKTCWSTWVGGEVLLPRFLHFRPPPPPLLPRELHSPLSPFPLPWPHTCAPLPRFLRFLSSGSSSLPSHPLNSARLGSTRSSSHYSWKEIFTILKKKKYFKIILTF